MAEWRKLLSAPAVEHVEKVFKAIDVDASGAIDSNEFFEAQKLLAKVAPPEFNVFDPEAVEHDDIDTDANGLIDLDEFAASLVGVYDILGDRHFGVAMERIQQAFAEKPLKRQGRAKRRAGYTAERMVIGEYKAPVHAKPAEDSVKLMATLTNPVDSKLAMLFGDMSTQAIKEIIDALEVREIKEGTDLIASGEFGDFFYIVKTGQFDLFAQRDGTMVKVWEAGPGYCFGEQALLYNAPRAATVKAAGDAVVWALEREAFRHLVIANRMKAFEQKKDFACKVPIFQDLSNEEIATVVELLDTEDYSEGEAIIEQGEIDDKMFIIESGEAYAAISGAEGEVIVKEYTRGDFFGEIALLLGTPRAATVYAKGDCTCLYIDRETFRRVLGPIQEVLKRNVGSYQQYADAIQQADDMEKTEQEKEDRASSKENDGATQVGRRRGVAAEKVTQEATITIVEKSEEDKQSLRELIRKTSDARMKICFGFLSDEALETVVSALAHRDVPSGELIIKQGDQGDFFYICKTGKFEFIKDEVAVGSCGPGMGFGELAMLYSHPRAATVKAAEDSTVWALDRQTFLVIKAGLVTAGQLASRSESAAVELPSEDGKAEETAAASAASKMAALKEKIAEDFKRPSLVTPCEKFVIESANFQVFGKVSPSQKFKMDKELEIRGNMVDVGSAEDALNTWGKKYSWKIDHGLKGAVVGGTLCQKGQKSADDPTPNQDNYCITVVQQAVIYGVCDGHGPFGHLVSYRLVQSVPHFIVKSSKWPKDIEGALKEGFLAAQDDLKQFSKTEELNLDASGSSGTFMVHIHNALYFAWIGDSRVTLGSWNRKAPGLKWESAEHSPGLPTEKERLLATGKGDVIEDFPGHWRLNIKGANYPGLTMSRVFGDFACEQLGVIAEPEQAHFLVQPADQWYVILASDGIWEFLESEKAIELTNKKLRMKGPVDSTKFVTDAARRRWEAMEGSYCDDITCIMLQLNMEDKNAASVETSLFL
mmetsp:Transcript_45760/g.97742  ORF Transcript_45760/g.97742 Transcript_45760/m.97742 type:complete len:993 (-) Transcript_45760:66-3044(-)